MIHNFIFINRLRSLDRSVKPSFSLGQKERGTTIIDFPDGFKISAIQKSGQKRFLKTAQFKGIVLYTEQQAQRIVSSILRANPIDVASMKEHDCFPISGMSADFLYKLSSGELIKIAQIEEYQRKVERSNVEIRKLIPDSLWNEREEQLEYLDKAYALFPKSV